MASCSPDKAVYTPMYRKDIRSRISFKLTFDRTLRFGNSSKIAEWVMRYNHQSKIMAFYFLYTECFNVLEKAQFKDLDELLDEMIVQTSLYHSNHLLKRTSKPGKSSHWHSKTKPIHVKTGKGKFGIKQHGTVKKQTFQKNFPNYDSFLHSNDCFRILNRCDVQSEI